MTAAAFLALLRRFAAPLFLIAFAVMLVLAVWLGWKHAGERAAAVRAAQARGGAVTAQAGERAGAQATEATAALGDREIGRMAKERNTRDAILQTPDAAVDAGAAGRAGLVGLCERALYRDDPGCAELRRPDSAPAAR